MRHGGFSAALAAVALAGALLTHGVQAGTAAPGVSLRPSAHPLLERTLVDELNAVRARHGLPPLRARGTLARAAAGHSQYLSGTARLVHESRGGKPFWTRLVAAGYPRARAMGENLALMPSCRGAVGPLARRVVGMWMASPTHRRNVLDRRFLYAGTSVVSAGDCTRHTVFTADFGG
jgi:uncharacterized protein YkwD